MDQYVRQRGCCDTNEHSNTRMAYRLLTTMSFQQSYAKSEYGANPSMLSTNVCCVCTRGRGRGLCSVCVGIALKRMSLALFSRWRLYIDNFTPPVDLMNDSAHFFCNCCVFCVLCECLGHYEDVVLISLCRNRAEMFRAL